MKISSRTLRVTAVVFGLTAISVVLIQWRATKEVSGQQQREPVALEQSADPAPPAKVSSDDREHRELLRLRSEVRDLRERATQPNPAVNANQTPSVAQLPADSAPKPEPSAAPIQRSGLTLEWKGMEQFATNKYADALERLGQAGTEMDRYFALGDAAKLSFAFGETEKAATYATELLALADKFKREPWSGGSGDAVYAANMVLGRLAIEQGAIEDAKRYLLAAAGTAGSPVLGTFGPNTSLAQELLERGEREAVLQYFERCGNFWKSEKLQQWTEDVNAGRMPKFGANLVY